MELAGFPGCCGGIVIVNFPLPSYDANGGLRPYAPGMVTLGGAGPTGNPANSQEEMARLLDEKIAASSQVAFVCIARNARQRDHWKRLIYRKGFRRVAYGLNQNHNSDVFLYVLSNHRKHPNGEDDRRLPEVRDGRTAAT
ncbi:MAG TPA: hypothetical protein VKA31_11490 [Mariprofundaceae bacterium]|nr:hypothetical protein [Mariprofundaceae bacterium]